MHFYTINILFVLTTEAHCIFTKPILSVSNYILDIKVVIAHINMRCKQSREELHSGLGIFWQFPHNHRP